MSESEALNPMSDAAAGALLRQARESQRMSLEHLASVIKVPVGKLQALESEDWTTLSDPNLARALAMTVCRALKVDSTQIMSRMPAAVAISLGAGREPLNQPFKEFSHTGLTFERSPRLSLRLPRLSSTFIAPLVLLLVAAGIYLVPDDIDWKGLLPSRAPAEAETASAPQASASDPALPQSDMAAPADAVPVVADSATSAASAPVAAASAASSVVVAAVAPVVAASSAAAPVASSALPAAASASAVVEGGSRIAMSAKEAAWVEIRDANGAKIFSRQMAAGERVELQGRAPFKVHAGNAPTLTMQFNGQPVDLASVTRMNVARIELK